MEENVVAYNYIKKNACVDCIACEAWSDSLTGDDKLLVTAMKLPINLIKKVREGLLHALVKLWKRNFASILMNNIECDARFRAAMRMSMVKLSTRRMM